MEGSVLNQKPAEPAKAAAPAASAKPKAKNSNKGLIIGIIAGGVVLIGLVVTIIIIAINGGNKLSGLYKLEGSGSIYEMTIDFKGDGKCDYKMTSKYSSSETEHTCSYDDKTITVDGDPADYTIDGDKITVKSGSTEIKFVKQ